MVFLSAKAVSATASLFCIWIVELETTLLNAIVVIYSRAVQEQIALLVDNNFDTVLHG